METGEDVPAAALILSGNGPKRARDDNKLEAKRARARMSKARKTERERLARLERQDWFPLATGAISTSSDFAVLWARAGREVVAFSELFELLPATAKKHLAKYIKVIDGEVLQIKPLMHTDAFTRGSAMGGCLQGLVLRGKGGTGSASKNTISALEKKLPAVHWLMEKCLWHVEHARSSLPDAWRVPSVEDASFLIAHESPGQQLATLGFDAAGGVPGAWQCRRAARARDSCGAQPVCGSGRPGAPLCRAR